MEETGVRKYHAVTARTASFIGRDVIGRYCGLGYEQRLKAILLSCSVSVFGSIAAFAGAPGPSHDNAAATTQRTGPAASQTVDECLAWDIACRLEQPVWLVAGPGDRGHEGGAGGGTDTGAETGTSDDGTSDGGTGDGGHDGGTSDGGTSDGGTSDGGTSDGGTSDGGGDDGGGDDGGGGRDNKGLGNGDENDDSSDNGSGNTDDDNPGKGGGGKGGNGHGGSER
jgi:hypothetical protein